MIINLCMDKKLSLFQVCCTAIVYATDRKNTKVEFPEARIYEETLNCLLYENRNGPDQELMQATSTRYVKNFNEMNRFKVNLFFFSSQASRDVIHE